MLPDGKALLPLKKGGLGHTYAAMLIPVRLPRPDRMLVQDLDFAWAPLTPSPPQVALELLSDPCVMRLKAPPREAAAIDHTGAPDTGSRRSEGLCSERPRQAGHCQAHLWNYIAGITAPPRA